MKGCDENGLLWLMLRWVWQGRACLGLIKRM